MGQIASNQVSVPKLPDINPSRGLYRQPDALGRASYAASNADMPLYQRASGLANEKLSQALSRAKSKDQLPDAHRGLRERYLSKAGAQQIVAGGRLEKERLLMDRYRRSGESEA